MMPPMIISQPVRDPRYGLISVRPTRRTRRSRRSKIQATIAVSDHDHRHRHEDERRPLSYAVAAASAASVSPADAAGAAVAIRSRCPARPRSHWPPACLRESTREQQPGNQPPSGPPRVAICERVTVNSGSGTANGRNSRPGQPRLSCPARQAPATGAVRPDVRQPLPDGTGQPVPGRQDRSQRKAVSRSKATASPVLFTA